MKKGFTLVELLVAIGLFSIIVTIAVGGFANALHTQREVTALIAAQSNASLALEQMTREVRTGSLFCRGAGGTAIQPNVDPSCSSCVSTGGANPTWTCHTLEFDNAEGTDVIYSLSGGALLRNEKGSISEITSDNVAIKNLTFTLFGHLEGDNWTPRITISMEMGASSTDPALAGNVINLQTTVSARQPDCAASTGAC